MRKLYLLGAVSAFPLLVHSNANAYYVQVTGQSLANGDVNEVVTNLAETDGATSLSFDTGTIFGGTSENPGSARSAASAYLSTGELNIFAQSTGLAVASASAEFRDLLTFDLPDGVTSSQLTVNLSIDGTISGSSNGQIALHLNCDTCYSPGGSDSDSLLLQDFISPALLTATITIEEGFGYFLQASLTGSTGLFVPSLIDLGNSGNVSLVLEEGVTFSSESGVFLSAVPLPGTVWLFGSGLLGMIRLARHKRSA